MKIELEHIEPLPESTSEELAKCVLNRCGLTPRKKDGQAQFHRLILELGERKKTANRDKKPEAAVMTVEAMGVHAGIKRQTMYDYLGRWLSLQILKKTSFVSDGKVIIGYELNGPNLEAAFKKAQTVLLNHSEQTLDIIRDLQATVKKEKLKANHKFIDDEDISAGQNNHPCSVGTNPENTDLGKP